MKDYLRQAKDVNKAVDTLRRRGFRVGVPMQTAEGAMLIPVGELALTAGQILELSERDELNQRGLHRFTKTQKPDDPEPTCAVREQAANESNEAIRILVVDDSAVSRKLVEHAFSGEPYQVYFAESGQEALDLMMKHRPDVVITDCVMPDLSGLTLCQMIQNKPECKDTYVILLTSNSEDRDIAEAIAAGADGYLTKPLQKDKLFAQIRMAEAVLKARRRPRLAAE